MSLHDDRNSRRLKTAVDSQGYSLVYSQLWMCETKKLLIASDDGTYIGVKQFCQARLTAIAKLRSYSG